VDATAAGVDASSRRSNFEPKAMPSDTRDRILYATADLFRRQGYAGTGMKQIAAEAAAPFGSLYHFFPGGKEDLGAQVIRTSGRFYAQVFAALALENPDVVAAVGDFFTAAAGVLRASDYADACPIAIVALEVASTNEPLRVATAEVFTEWIEGVTDYFASARVPRERSRELAFTMLSLLEGAFIFSRAMRSTESLHVAGATAMKLVAQAVGETDAVPHEGAPDPRPQPPPQDPGA
jgi:AcrR family transcriptional regulator